MHRHRNVYSTYTYIDFRTRMPAVKAGANVQYIMQYVEVQLLLASLSIAPDFPECPIWVFGSLPSQAIQMREVSNVHNDYVVVLLLY